MITFDQLGLPFTLNKIPDRIVSLVPSITELLYDLGLGNKVVGRTKFCIYPDDGFPNAKIIGGTKNVHTSIVKGLNPDLVFANKEENVKEQVSEISTFCPCFTTVVTNTSEGLQMIADLGKITNSSHIAEELQKIFSASFNPKDHKPSIKMVYLIWKDPYMTIGGDTFISNFMNDFGFKNCLAKSTRYPEIGVDEMIQYAPDIIFLSSEPFPFKERHLEEIQQKTGIKVQLIDGSYCSWYGSRMLKGAVYLRQIRNKLLENGFQD